MCGAFHIQVDGPVARVTLDRPAVRNAMRPQELHALADALARLGTDGRVRLIVLTGSGDRAFCSGLNLADRPAMEAELSGTGSTGLGAVVRVAHEISVPILGRINGACVAGGMGLLAACSAAVAVDSAIFALLEVKVGLYPHVVIAGWGGRIAPDDLRGMADSGAPVDAAAALRMGLVDVVVPRDRLDDQVQRVAQDMLTRGRRRRLPDPRSICLALNQAEARTRAHHAAAPDNSTQTHRSRDAIALERTHT